MLGMHQHQESLQKKSQRHEHLQGSRSRFKGVSVESCMLWSAQLEVLSNRAQTAMAENYLALASKQS